MHLGNAGWENKLINSQAVSENKQRPSLWELMQSDQNRTPMCALVFSSGPLPSERQSEYCIRRSVCVESQCVRHTNRHRGIQMNKWSGQTEGRRRQMKDIQRLKEKGRERCMMGGWYRCLAEGWESSQPCTHTHTRACAQHTSTAQCQLVRHTNTHTDTRTHFCCCEFELQIIFFFSLNYQHRFSVNILMFDENSPVTFILIKM